MADVTAQAPLAGAKNASGRSGRRSRQRKGEAQQATAAGLDLLRVLGWLVLHDVAVPGEDDRLIDHVLVGPRLTGLDLHTVDVPGSDHRGLVAEVAPR